MKPEQRNAVWLGGSVLLAGLLPVLLFGFLPENLFPAECPPAFRSTSLFEQWLVVVTAFGIKPAYILLSLVTIIWLWRQQSPDLVTLRWGLTAFWLGENACSVDYLLLNGNSDLWEYLHNFGMTLCFAFVTYALLEGMDRRLIKYSAAQDRCAALSLCRACIKYTDAPCGLRRVFAMLIPATMVITVMLLSADIRPYAYVTNIAGVKVHYAELLSDQWFELRYCPVIALLLLTTAWLVLLLKRTQPVPLAKVLFAAAIGPLGFGFMRLFLYGAYHDDLILSVVWEEITELIFTFAVLFILLVFRHSLFSRPTPAETTPSGSPESAA